MRHSVRSFTEENISNEELLFLVKAGMQAPSARNEQPWHFIQITDRDKLNQIADFHPYAKMASQAAAGILICGDRTLESSTGYIALDCAAATQNILLAAHDTGLGAVWIGVYPREERLAVMTDLFNLPQHIIAVSLVLLGHPATNPEAADRFIQDRLHLELWR